MFKKCIIFAAMKLHIFNPEHDIALAHHDPNFTAPHAGRQLRADLGFLPAVWADDGDMVLVDDVESALAHVRHLGHRVKEVVFITKADLRHTPFAQPLTGDGRNGCNRLEIVPWGWDLTLRNQLRKSLVDDSFLPDDKQLKLVREFSNRRFSMDILSQLTATDEQYVGESRYVEAISELETLWSDGHQFVAKVPWSSSGRGVRYMTLPMKQSDRRWMEHVIAQQGGIMVEPHYNKVKDFAMEFYADGQQLSYLGLSLFDTVKGAYSGNLLASEQVKREELGKYLSVQQLDKLRFSLLQLLTPLFANRYRGFFGVDMMLLTDGKIHPCVEINMRRTMGHVAIALTPELVGAKELMRIDYEHTRYHLRVRPYKSEINNDIL